MVGEVQVSSAQSSGCRSFENIGGGDPIFAGPIDLGTDLKRIEAGGITAFVCDDVLRSSQVNGLLPLYLHSSDRWK